MKKESDKKHATINKSPSIWPVKIDENLNGRLRLFEKTRSRKHRAYLTAYALTGQIMKASEVSKVDFRAHYYWLKHDPDYQALFDQAKEVALDLAESEI